MKRFNIYLFAIFVSIFLSSCGSVKEGFSGQKKNNSDEFLVEKKSPLLMPPDYNELPIPNPENVNENKENDQIKDLISNSENTKTVLDNNDDNSGSIENLILGKIKNN
jgi:hypothetical protein